MGTVDVTNYEKLKEHLEFNKYYKVAHKIDSCSDFSSFAECADCHAWHFVGTRLCKNRFCRVCASKRGLIYLKKYGEIFNHFEQQGYKLYFMTFTLKSMDNLQDMLDRFNKTFVKFREKYSCWYDVWEGGVISREITYNPGVGWHVHIHIIGITKVNFSPYKLKEYNKVVSQKWLEKTGDSFITQIKPCKKKEKDGRTYNTHLLELFKYITDLDDIPKLADNEFKIVYDTLHKRRLISSFGLLYNYTSEIEKSTEEELDNCDYNKLLDSVCAVCGCDILTLTSYITLEVDRKVYRLKPKE